MKKGIVGMCLVLLCTVALTYARTDESQFTIDFSVVAVGGTSYPGCWVHLDDGRVTYGVEGCSYPLQPGQTIRGRLARSYDPHSQHRVPAIELLFHDEKGKSHTRSYIIYEQRLD